MARARRINLSERVAARIKDLILEEGLKPGDRLPTEQEMAARFGVSRVSVREATKSLSFLGIIDAAPRRGLTIGQVDMTRVTEYLAFHIALSNYPRRELLQTRRVIEAGALPYVAEAMAVDGSVYDRLAQVIEDGRDSLDIRRRIHSDVAFHRALLEVSGVGPLLVFDNLLQIFFTRFFKEPSQEDWSVSMDHHMRLIDLLRDGHVDGARHLLSEHLAGYDVATDGIPQA